MTFDYFNAGRTAWGKKISGVFNTLELMAKAAEDRVTEVTSDTDFFLQFVDRNYRAPEPVRGDLPARVEDMLNVTSNVIQIKEVKYDSGRLNVTAIYHDAMSGRSITLSGSTTMSSGYVYAKPPNGSKTIKGQLTFSSGERDTELYKETALFSFKIIDNDVYINNFGNMNTQLKGALPITGFEMVKVGTNSYTATEAYECVIVSGGNNWFNLKLNNQVIFDVGSLQFSQLHVTLYLKKGDKVTGDTLQNIWKIKYKR